MYEWETVRGVSGHAAEAVSSRRPFVLMLLLAFIVPSNSTLDIRQSTLP